MEVERDCRAGRRPIHEQAEARRTQVAMRQEASMDSLAHEDFRNLARVDEGHGARLWLQS